MIILFWTRRLQTCWFVDSDSRFYDTRFASVWLDRKRQADWEKVVKAIDFVSDWKFQTQSLFLFITFKAFNLGWCRGMKRIAIAWRSNPKDDLYSCLLFLSTHSSSSYLVAFHSILNAPKKKLIYLCTNLSKTRHVYHSSLKKYYLLVFNNFFFVFLSIYPVIFFSCSKSKLRQQV